MTESWDIDANGIRRADTIVTRCTKCGNSVECKVHTKNGISSIPIQELEGWSFPPAKCPECAEG